MVYHLGIKDDELFVNVFDSEPQFISVPYHTRLISFSSLDGYNHDEFVILLIINFMS